jgi:hypothetical protein
VFLIEWYKVRLITKSYIQKKSIYYKEIFSLASKKDLFRIKIVLIAHFHLELHWMDVKTSFQNGNFSEKVYMNKPEDFFDDTNSHLFCKLKKSIYELKQAYR